MPSQRGSPICLTPSSLSTSPTSLTQRQLLLTKAQTLAGQFNQVDYRLNRLNWLGRFDPNRSLDGK